ncbi:hypothetical protein ACFRJ8_08605 [Arthrobacter sp. NPDC056886]|uniref:hypothetical protein n=1 Tax=Arthrobacter sp. NPDC056886 TaxID=3345960 RepID=UPI00366ECD57
MMYGPQGLRFNVVAPGSTITNIVANWGSQLAAERLGSIFSCLRRRCRPLADMASRLLRSFLPAELNLRGSGLHDFQRFAHGGHPLGHGRGADESHPAYQAASTGGR